MPDQADRTPVEPGMPEGTTAGLVSPAGAPLYPELGAGRTSGLVRPVGRALDRAGNSLKGGANYLRTHGIAVIGDDFADGVRHHPLVSAGVAVGVGWMLGRMMGGGGRQEDHGREAPSPEEQHEETPDREQQAEGSMLDRARGRMIELVAAGIASIAARKIRDRIAGV